MDILVTVGMGPWPFDRLLRAVAGLCSQHRVFAQTGPSRVVLPCPSAPFIGREELQRRLEQADVVITHAGNTVRLVQRAGKVPIAVARTAAAAEMPNNHQVEFLRYEERHGRVVAVWNVGDLPAAVARHPDVERRLIAERQLDQPTSAGELAARLDAAVQRLVSNPFRGHPLRRYAYAWGELSGASGRHLDVGCNTGDFVGKLSETSDLECFAVDPHPEYIRDLQRQYPRVQACRVAPQARLPYPDGWFRSVSLLDVLEHCPSETALLAEIRRVLQPGGLLVLSVPARHALSWMDPDNIKVRFPRLHRAAYSLRFGRQVYHQRFVDTSNGLWGEMSIGKREHTHYRQEALVGMLAASGFEVVRVAGANLLWRLFQVPALVGPAAARRVLESAMWLDGVAFDRANLFITARRSQCG
jgi:SAM-dependent methyltransferase